MIKRHGYTKYIHDKCRCDVCLAGAQANRDKNNAKNASMKLPRPPMVCPFCNIRYSEHPLRSCFREAM